MAAHQPLQFLLLANPKHNATIGFCVFQYRTSGRTAGGSPTNERCFRVREVDLFVLRAMGPVVLVLYAGANVTCGWFGLGAVVLFQKPLYSHSLQLQFCTCQLNQTPLPPRKCKIIPEHFHPAGSYMNTLVRISRFGRASETECIFSLDWRARS